MDSSDVICQVKLFASVAFSVSFSIYFCSFIDFTIFCVFHGQEVLVLKSYHSTIPQTVYWMYVVLCISSVLFSFTVLK